MSDQIVIPVAMNFLGAATFRVINLPAGAVGDAEVKAAAGLAASKLEHQHAIRYAQADGSDVAAATEAVYTVRGVTGTIEAVQAACLTAPTGGDKAFTVDLKLGNEGSPVPASVLSAPIAYAAAQSDLEVEAGTITSPDLAAGDTLAVVVAVSGSTGSQGQGLIVTITLREDAD